MSAAETSEDVDETKALDFLKKVFQIDTDKYEANLLRSSTRPWNGVEQTTGQYWLSELTYDADSSMLTVDFCLWNNELIDCSYHNDNDGAVKYIQKPDGDLRKIATDFLQRYQTYTNDKQIDQMINLLNKADIVDGYTKVDGDLQFSVLVNNRIYLTWSNIMTNGADYSRLGVMFENGMLTAFRDDRAFYVLGSDVVNVSKEQAVSIALEQATSLSYTVGDEVISGFDVVTEYILVQPSAMAKPSESPLVRHPIWIVDLPLRDVYPGMVSLIRVMLWTDTGEVIRTQPLGSGGLLDDSTHDSTQIDSSLQNNDSHSDNIPLTLYIVGVCTAIIIPIAILAVVFTRKSKQK